MKKWYIGSLVVLLLGWFPFMWLCMYGMHHKEIGVYILFVGVFLCGSATIAILEIIENKTMFCEHKEWDMDCQIKVIRCKRCGKESWLRDVKNLFP